MKNENSPLRSSSSSPISQTEQIGSDLYFQSHIMPEMPHLGCDLLKILRRHSSFRGVKKNIYFYQFPRYIPGDTRCMGDVASIFSLNLAGKLN